MIKCDCEDRIGIIIESNKMFKSLQTFFREQVEKGVFYEIPVKTPLYIGKGASGEVLEWYADKLYKCNICGTLWEFQYPNFPAYGEIRKFEDGIYPKPETNF